MYDKGIGAHAQSNSLVIMSVAYMYVVIQHTNISAIDQANSEILKRGTHVRTCSPIPLGHVIVADVHGVIQYTNFERNRPSQSRDIKKRMRTCARAVQYPCHHVRVAYVHGVIQHTKYERNRPSQS